MRIGSHDLDGSYGGMRYGALRSAVHHDCTTYLPCEDELAGQYQTDGHRRTAKAHRLKKIHSYTGYAKERQNGPLIVAAQR